MEDSDIVALFWSRDEKAITETAAKYGSYCSSIAEHILGCAADAEECVNDTYFSAWNTIPPHRPKVLATFLGKLVRNLAFNRYNLLHAQKRGGHETALILDELAEIVSGKENVEDSVAERELLRELERFLRGLPPEKRLIFLRRYWYSDSIGEIAKQLSKSENAVTVALNRLRKRLRDDLTKRGYVL